MALHIGPLETIIRVTWPSGVFVLVNILAKYLTGVPGSRNIAIALTEPGTAAGGVIVAQKRFEIAAAGPGNPAQTLWRAVLKFDRVPVSFLASFTIQLTGTIIVEDVINPGTMVEPFCGNQTVSVVGSPYFVRQFGGGQRGIFQTISATTTSPAGTATTSYERQVADVTIDDVGRGGYSNSASVNSIWYQDVFGNWVDTHRDCSELSGGTTVAKRIEGFFSIDLKVFPKSGYEVTDSTGWTATTLDDDIVAAFSTQAIGGYQFRCTVPQLIPGLNADFQPIFDDLPDGTYEFKLARSVFSTITPTPIRPLAIYSVDSVYLLNPLFGKYQIQAATRNPYKLHLTVPSDLKIGAGNQPASNTPFTP
jgi:hypothetical protein